MAKVKETAYSKAYKPAYKFALEQGASHAQAGVYANLRGLGHPEAESRKKAGF